MDEWREEKLSCFKRDKNEFDLGRLSIYRPWMKLNHNNGIKGELSTRKDGVDLARIDDVYLSCICILL